MKCDTIVQLQLPNLVKISSINYNTEMHWKHNEHNKYFIKAHLYGL